MVKDAKTKQRYPFPKRDYLRLFRVQPKLKAFMEKSSYSLFPPFKLSSIAMEYNKIIHITKIVFRLKPVFHELVKLIEIDIREELRGHVSQRHPFPWNNRLVLLQNEFYQP